MKNHIIIYLSFLTALVLLMSSCVSDDISFPDISEVNIVKSPAVVTLLNELQSQNNPGNILCFEFEFPIELGYNTDSRIRVDSFEGMLDVVSGQSDNFNITGLEFPIRIKFKDASNTSTIQDEDGLIDAMKECQIDTFRDDFDRLFNQCFKPDYPVTLFNRSEEEVIINSDDGYHDFILLQGERYQPSFKFPITLLQGANNTEVSVQTYYEFYQVINDCVGCPGIEFRKELLLLPASYRFIPNIEDVRATYTWFIDGEQVGNASERVYEYDFLEVTDGSVPGGEGTYEVCVKVITPDCLSGIKFCRDIEVVDTCPELSFIIEQEGQTTSYNFFAEFPGINDIEYEWLIDNEFKEMDGGANGDNIYFFQFDPGTYTICIRTETPDCPNGKEFCKELIVN